MKNIIVGLIYLSYTFKITDAAIVPKDKTYEVMLNEENFPIEWVYDHEESMFFVTWLFKNSTSPTETTVMTQLSGAQAQPVTGYDISHDQNGTIQLQKITNESIGIYYCRVSYTGASGIPLVTGTATVKLQEDSTEEEKSQCEAGCIAGVTAGCCACLAGAGVGGYIYKKKKNGKGDKGDTSRDVESTRSSPEKAKNKLLNEKKQVHPDSEGKKPFRPQPSPPPEANINHSSNPDKHKTGHVSAGSGLPAIQGADNGPSLTKKTDPLPPIGGTPRTDKTY